MAGNSQLPGEQTLTVRETLLGCWQLTQVGVGALGVAVGFGGGIVLLVLLAGFESPHAEGAILGGLLLAVAALHIVLGLLSLSPLVHRGLASRRPGRRPPPEASCLAGCSTVGALALLGGAAGFWLLLLVEG